MTKMMLCQTLREPYSSILPENHMTKICGMPNSTKNLPPEKLCFSGGRSFEEFSIALSSVITLGHGMPFEL